MVHMSYLLQLTPGKTRVVAHVAPTALLGKHKLSRVAPIAHPGEIRADGPSSID